MSKRVKPDAAQAPAALDAEWRQREAVATTLSAGQKAKMRSAEAVAKRHLASLGGAQPTEAMVLEVLTAIGNEADWPKQTRPNVTDSGKPVPGMCLGLVFGLGGGGAKASLISESYPGLASLVTKWARVTLPKTRDGDDFPFSSLQINYNYAAKKHVDGNNIGPSYIVSIGEHTGGALWTADQGVIDCRGNWRLFDGNREHATEPFQGTRISFIAFTHGLYNKLTPYVANQLGDLGFNAARTDGKDLPFFEAFRIEKSYLTDDHNAAFKAFREARKAEDMPPPAHPGAVAVECYGRQAERGGGWVSYVTGEAPSSASDKGKKRKAAAGGASTVGVGIVELAPNTTGIWVTELAVLGRGGFALRGHQQFNLYKDLTGETRRFGAYVEALGAGQAVVVSIADTACAKSRPLGPKVYEALGKLGAPTGMEPIAYRKAWALVGFKGCPPGEASCAMGKRSTLLRLEATFGLDAGGKTVVLAKKEDQTSIIDVVTGGNQDRAMA